MDSTNSSKDAEFPPSNEKGFWKQLVSSLIRPPKRTYSKSLLGSQVLTVYSKRYHRQDIQVPHESQTIDLSLFQSEPTYKSVVLYLHGNSSCKVEALGLIEFLPEGYSLASFDFLGCGNSKQQFISLGVRESKQIATIVKYLEDRGFEVILWGRSMGAASCLMFGGTNVTVVDSPFVSLKKVCQQTAANKKPSYLPGCMVSCLFPIVYCKLRSDVKQQAQFDMNDLDIVECVKKISSTKSIIFLAALQDGLINPQHSEKLFSHFLGTNKKILTFEGTHNTKRPSYILSKVFKYVEERIQAIKGTRPSFNQKKEIELLQMSHKCSPTLRDAARSI